MNSKIAGGRIEQRALLRHERPPAEATIVARAAVIRGPNCAVTSSELREPGRWTADRC